VDRVYKGDIPAARRALERLRAEFSRLDSKTDWKRLRVLLGRVSRFPASTRKTVVEAPLKPDGGRSPARRGRLCAAAHAESPTSTKRAARE
jgi:hypothetical protein